MEPISNLMTGYIYDAEEGLKVKHENLLKNFAFAKRTDISPFILTRGNIFKNEKASKNSPNDVVIFEVDFNDNDFYFPSFRGFLYPDGSVNGKFKYSVDAKSPDENFEGIYKINEKGVLVMYGTWQETGSVQSYFVELFHKKRIKTKKA